MVEADALQRIDDLLVFDDEPQPDGATAAAWRVLVVDDDETVHHATRLALSDVVIEGRPVKLLHAHSATQALAIARDGGALAVALVDVVMERADAGLQLVRELRDTLGLRALRLVLRTGQPGYAPELETVRDYDIDGYWTKTELTRSRLYVCLTTAVRAYRRYTDIERQRDELLQLTRLLDCAHVAEREAAERRLAAERALREAHETMELCIEQRTRELSAAVEELDAFNRRVAHDLRGPLYGLSGLSGLIQGRLESGDIKQVGAWVAMMETQSRRLADLVAGLLNLSQVARGGLRVQRVPLADLVAEARQTLLLTDEPNAQVVFDVGPLPVVPCDPVLMRQVFVNLLGNAMKFTRRVAQPLIHVRAEREGAGAEAAWRIRVSDNGVGFAAGQADRLFKPFARLHPDEYEGSGIGLTVVQRIVQQHGGQVRAEGGEGSGASFSFTLPS